GPSVELVGGARRAAREHERKEKERPAHPRKAITRSTRDGGGGGGGSSAATRKSATVSRRDVVDGLMHGMGSARLTTRRGATRSERSPWGRSTPDQRGGGMNRGNPLPAVRAFQFLGEEYEL